MLSARAHPRSLTSCCIAQLATVGSCSYKRARNSRSNRKVAIRRSCRMMPVSRYRDDSEKGETKLRSIAAPTMLLSIAFLGLPMAQQDTSPADRCKTIACREILDPKSPLPQTREERQRRRALLERRADVEIQAAAADRAERLRNEDAYYAASLAQVEAYKEARNQGLDEVTATAVADKARKEVLEKEMNAISLEKQEVQEYEQRLAAKRAEIRSRASQQQPSE